MLTFLRKIRRSLIESGSARKYLLYAVGEVALVVIGILIALQINNLNQEKIESQKELDLVSTLYKELTANLEYIENRIKGIENKQENSLLLLDRFIPQPIEIPVDTFFNYWHDAAGIPFFNPKIASVKRVVTNEEFNWIQFDSLKLLLNEYILRIDKTIFFFEMVMDYNWGDQPLNDVVSYTDRARTFGQRNQNRFILSELKSSKIFEFSSSNVFSNPTIESYLSWRLTRYSIIKANLINMREQIQELMNFIDSHYKMLLPTSLDVNKIK